MRQWYQVHKYTGIVCLTIFFLLCFSGLMIMVKSVFFMNFNQLTASYTGESLWHSSDNKVQELLKANPNLELRSMTIRPEKSMLTVRFKEKSSDELIRYHFYDKNNEWVSVNNELIPSYYDASYLDALTHWLARMHSNLGLGNYGRLILFIFILISLMACATGYFLQRSLIHTKSKVGYYSLHRLLGIMVAPYCIILLISGGLFIGYSYISNINYSEHNLLAQEYFSRQSVEGDIYSYTEIFEAVKNIYPEKEVVSIHIPSARELTENSSSTYYFRLAAKEDLLDCYQGYLVTDDLWVSAYKNNNLMRYEAVSPWYMKWLAKGIDWHFKNHEYPVLVFIWIFYLMMSCLLAITPFIKSLRHIRFTVNTKYPMNLGVFMLTCACLFLPLYGPIGIYAGIGCGILSIMLVGVSIRGIEYK